mgnify:CR=1 FL=1
MNGWSNKQYGVLIGVLLVVLVSVIGLGATALAVVFGVLGYFIGSYLDRDFDLEDIRDRTQGNRTGGQGR